MSRIASAVMFAVVVGIGLFALLLLIVRMVVFPHIDQYRDSITAALAQQVKQPVEIDALATGWDGWNPKLVIEGLRIGRPAPGSGPAVLELPRLDLTLAWTSLVRLELRVKQLVIERPHLAIRRDSNGVVHVAGIAIDLAQGTDDSALTDWLLRQREIVVRNASISWQDERHQARPLVLDNVHLRLENSFGHHRFGLTGNPPVELAAPVDIRGDLGQASFRDWRHAGGQIYTRLDYADIAAWREWLPWPVEINSGKGALRAWFTIVQGEVSSVVADVELADVRTRLMPDLPELALTRVSGRAGWRFGKGAREFFSQRLAFTTTDGQKLEPTTASLVMHVNAENRVERSRLEFDQLALEPLRELAAHLPLPAAWRTNLTVYAPRGTLTRGALQWDGAADAPVAFDAATDFKDVGFLAEGSSMGVTGMSGTLKATQAGGSVKLASQKAAVMFPHLLPAPVALDSVEGQMAWVREGAHTAIRVDRINFTNAHAAGHVSGTYRHDREGPGTIDVDAQFTRAALEGLPRYLPLTLSEGTRRWVADAIKRGTIDEARLKLKGDLAAFPFADGKSGIFAVDVKGHGFDLEYAGDWPALTEVSAEVHFHGAGVSVVGSQGRVYGVALGTVKADIPDLRSPVVNVDGEASGPTQDFLRFIEESPVGEWIDHFTAAARAGGNGKLALKLALPLRDLAAHRATGEYEFTNNQLKLAGVPGLNQLNGRLSFANRELRARDITAEALGGPIKVSIASADGRVRLTGTGSANVTAVRQEFPFPFGERVTGTADWSLALDSRAGTSSWVLESPLKGVAIDLPAPLTKAANETIPLRVERRAAASGNAEDTVVATLGDVAAATLHRKLSSSAAEVDRALVSLGRASRRPDAGRAERAGMWVRAELPALDIDQWLDLNRAAGASAAATAGTHELALMGIELDVQDLAAFGRRFTQMKVVGAHARDEWKLDLKGGEVIGNATWSAPSTDAPHGRIVARLAHLQTPGARDSVADPAVDANGDAAAGTWPEIDITAESFASGSRDLGRLELLAKPLGTEWRIERLSLENEAGRLQGQGAWRAGRRQEQTRLEMVLDVKDAGAFLARLGHPGAVQAAPTKITGQLNWAGAPTDFDYPSLSGAFSIQVGSGRFLKIEPGIGKLLGVLSLQALPRRITLDFRDVFSEGFAFDRVTGNVRIANGVMATEDLRLSGPSAQVGIAGEADLAKETQRLRVRVQPTLSAGVSAGAALLFLANPVVGAAVGAGSLLAQKVLRDPIEQMFTHDYSVTGSWSDPVVARSGPASAAAPFGSASK
ncbi:MAG: YhdP family protein [Betaproteobacteria bacterium]